MDSGTYRDMLRMYILILGAFCVVFFFRWVLGGYLIWGVEGAALCAGMLVVVLVIGAIIIYGALERFSEFYNLFSSGGPRQPVYYYAPQYPAAPPPAYQPLSPAGPQPAPRYPQHPGGQAPGYPQYPQGPYTQAYGRYLYYPVPAYYQPAPNFPNTPPAYGGGGPVYQPRDGYYPEPPRQAAPRQPVPKASTAPPRDEASNQRGTPQPPEKVTHVEEAIPAVSLQEAGGERQLAADGAPLEDERPPPEGPGLLSEERPPAPVPYSHPELDRQRPAIRVEDDRRPLSLPSAQWLMWVFLIAILLGGFSLWLLNSVPVLTVLIFPIAFIIGFSFPSLIWISYVYRFHDDPPLPGRPVLVAFTYGMLSTIPALLVNTFASVSLGAEAKDASIAVQLLTAALVAPLVEEFCKPWGVYIVREDVNGRLDGLIYGVTCGVGFALIENISYEASFLLGGSGTAAVWTYGSLARGLGSIMVHAVGAGIIGYAYGRLRKGRGSLLSLGVAYLLAILLHAAWNGASVLASSVSWGLMLQFGFMILFAVSAFFLIKHFIVRASSKDRGMSRPTEDDIY